MAKEPDPADSFSADLKTLTDEIRKQNREILEKKLLELTTACRVRDEISSVEDLEKCIEVLVNRIANLLSVEIVSLMLLDSQSSALMIKIAKGLEDEIVKDARVKLGDNIAGWVAKTGEPLLIEDITKDKRFVGRGKRYYTNSLLSVPLKVGSKVIGVINVNNKISKGIFRDEDLSILKTIADLAGVSIESAHLRQEIKAKDKVRLDVISDISHELRTPLSAIKESVNMLLDGIIGKMNDDQRKFLDLAKRNIERLHRLIDGLLELARADAANLSMNRSLFNIVHLVRTVTDSVVLLARNNDISLTARLPDASIEVWGDADKLTQVLINLLDNAIKYNMPGGCVDVRLEESAASVRICVSDTGLGISQENIGKIFDRFYRVSVHVKSQKPGSGLGLFITRDIIKVHGGEISVESEIGKGSKFTVTLPKDLRSQQ